MEKIQNYIDGELLAPNSGEYINNFCPSTGEIYSLIPDSDAKDIDAAVNSAKMHLNSGVRLVKKRGMIISCIWLI